jgi:hypothetical protein
VFFQLAVRTGDRFGRRPLQEGPRFGIKDASQKVVGRRVPNFQLYRRIEPGDLDQVRLYELSNLLRRR